MFSYMNSGIAALSVTLVEQWDLAENVNSTHLVNNHPVVYVVSVVR